MPDADDRERFEGTREMERALEGQTAVVTGGANGIGLATARALAAGGADLWICDLERLEWSGDLTTFGDGM